MESVTHSYLCKLRIISKIPINGRLDTTHNDINIYYGGVIGWVFRKVYGDNKENATKYLIDLYREINSFSDQLMYNITTEQNSIRKRKKINMLVSLTEKMKESLTGIRNLIGTYKTYLKIVSLLECLEQDLIIPQYKTLLKFIPVIYHTEILKSEITFSHIHMTDIFNGRVRSLSETDACQHDINIDTNVIPFSQPNSTSYANHNPNEHNVSNVVNNCVDDNISTGMLINNNITRSNPIDIPVKKIVVDKL
jgi:hypothetical protein